MIQEIPFQHVWSGSQHGLHCSFVLEHLDRSQQHLSCLVTVQQRHLAAHSQTLHIACDLTQVHIHMNYWQVNYRSCDESRFEFCRNTLRVNFTIVASLFHVYVQSSVTSNSSVLHSSPPHLPLTPILSSVVSSSDDGHIVTTLDSPDTVFR